MLPLEAMAHRLTTKTGKALYGKRKSTVETVFGIIKHIQGFRQFHLRGLESVQSEWNLVCIGRTGKTYIACALGHQASLKGYSVRYYRLPSAPHPRLNTSQGRWHGSYSKLLKAIAGLDLLIIDDWGLEPLTAATRNDLMEIMDDRYQQSATIIIS